MPRFMELDLEGQFADPSYPILASLVTPRPIALVTTISPDRKINAAPFSFLKVLGVALPFWRSPRAIATMARPRTRLGTSASLTSSW